MQTTTETKAVLIADKGRIVGFVKSNEPGKISLAVPADRAIMTPDQARQVATWLVEQADAVKVSETTTERYARLRNVAEAERQAQIRQGLGGYGARRF